MGKAKMSDFKLKQVKSPPCLTCLTMFAHRGGYAFWKSREGQVYVYEETTGWWYTTE